MRHLYISTIDLFEAKMQFELSMIANSTEFTKSRLFTKA